MNKIKYTIIRKTIPFTISMKKTIYSHSIYQTFFLLSRCLGYNSYYDINAIIFSPSTLLPFIQIQYTRIIGRLNFVNRSSSIRNVIITPFVRARQRAVMEILFSKVKKRLYLGGGGVKILDAYYHLTREMKREEEKLEVKRSVLNVREYFVNIPSRELYYKVEKKL